MFHVKIRKSLHTDVFLLIFFLLFFFIKAFLTFTYKIEINKEKKREKDTHLYSTNSRILYTHTQSYYGNTVT